VKCSYCGAWIVVPVIGERCPNHPDVLATATCNDCGNSYCRDCLAAYEIQGQAEGGVLLLCSICLAQRHAHQAERTILVGGLLVLIGMFLFLAHPIAGALWIMLFAVPVIIYGVYKIGHFYKESIPYAEHAEARETRTDRTTQEIYLYMLAEFIRCFGQVHGHVMLENRIKAYVERGLSREEAIRRFAEDGGY